MGYILQLIYTPYYLSGVLADDYESEDFTYTQKRDILQMNFVSCIFLLLRAFFLLKVFNPLRPYIRMVKEVIQNLVPFTVILLMGCFFLAVIFYMINELAVEA